MSSGGESSFDELTADPAAIQTLTSVVRGGVATGGIDPVVAAVCQMLVVNV